MSFRSPIPATVWQSIVLVIGMIVAPISTILVVVITAALPSIPAFPALAALTRIFSHTIRSALRIVTAPTKASGLPITQVASTVSPLVHILWLPISVELLWALGTPAAIAVTTTCGIAIDGRTVAIHEASRTHPVETVTPLRLVVAAPITPFKSWLAAALIIKAIEAISPVKSVSASAAASSRWDENARRVVAALLRIDRMAGVAEPAARDCDLDVDRLAAAALHRVLQIAFRADFEGAQSSHDQCLHSRHGSPDHDHPFHDPDPGQIPDPVQCLGHVPGQAQTHSRAHHRYHVVGVEHDRCSRDPRRSDASYLCCPAWSVEWWAVYRPHLTERPWQSSREGKQEH